MTLLTANIIRDLADTLEIRPTKKLGQNFVVDQGTVRKIVALAEIEGLEVIEVGPGLGSLTLGLLPVASAVHTIEIDPVLAAQLPKTVTDLQPENSHKLRAYQLDALKLATIKDDLAEARALVANLPYNVSVPVLLTALEELPNLERVLVMVQAEVADRIAARPGDSEYGIPSAKVAWFGDARRVATIGPSVFWPRPRIDSALVLIDCRDKFSTARPGYSQVARVIDQSFAQRRKTLRGNLIAAGYSSDQVAAACEQAGVDQGLRAERLGIAEFVALTAALEQTH